MMRTGNDPLPTNTRVRARRFTAMRVLRRLCTMDGSAVHAFEGKGVENTSLSLTSRGFFYLPTDT